jgi:hypothetical protein
MSRPGGPYRDDRFPPRQRPFPQQGGPQQGGPQQGYPPQRGYPDQTPDYGPGPDYGQGYAPTPDYGPGPGHGAGPDLGHGADPRYDQGYAPDPGYDRGYGDRGYDERGYGYDDRYADRDYDGPTRRTARPEPEPDYGDDGGGRGIIKPGLGLVLSLLGLAVQVASLVFLPWLSAAGDSATLPKLWDAAKDVGDGGGFSGAYVFLFTYPLAALGVLLSLVAVLESVVMKVIWAILAFLGVAGLAVKFGWNPLSGGGMNFSRQEITLGIIGLVVLVVVIFMLKMAMSSFRIIGGIILLVCAGVHVYALKDLTGEAGFSLLGIGAYGPAVGYVLAALAAFIGPRRIA